MPAGDFLRLIVLVPPKMAGTVGAVLQLCYWGARTRDSLGQRPLQPQWCSVEFGTLGGGGPIVAVLSIRPSVPMYLVLPVRVPSILWRDCLDLSLSPSGGGVIY